MVYSGTREANMRRRPSLTLPKGFSNPVWICKYCQGLSQGQPAFLKHLQHCARRLNPTGRKHKLSCQWYCMNRREFEHTMSLWQSLSPHVPLVDILDLATSDLAPPAAKRRKLQHEMDADNVTSCDLHSQTEQHQRHLDILCDHESPGDPAGLETPAIDDRGRALLEFLDTLEACDGGGQESCKEQGHGGEEVTSDDEAHLAEGQDETADTAFYEGGDDAHVVLSDEEDGAVSALDALIWGTRVRDPESDTVSVDSDDDVTRRPVCDVTQRERRRSQRRSVRAASTQTCDVRTRDVRTQTAGWRRGTRNVATQTTPRAVVVTSRQGVEDQVAAGALSAPLPPPPATCVTSDSGPPDGLIHIAPIESTDTGSVVTSLPSIANRPNMITLVIPIAQSGRSMCVPLESMVSPLSSDYTNRSSAYANRAQSISAGESGDVANPIDVDEVSGYQHLTAALAGHNVDSRPQVVLLGERTPAGGGNSAASGPVYKQTVSSRRTRAGKQAVVYRLDRQESLRDLLMSERTEARDDEQANLSRNTLPQLTGAAGTLLGNAADPPQVPATGGPVTSRQTQAAVRAIQPQVGGRSRRAHQNSTGRTDDVTVNDVTDPPVAITLDDSRSEPAGRPDAPPKLLTITGASNFTLYTKSRIAVTSRDLHTALAPRDDRDDVIAGVGVVVASANHAAAVLTDRVYVCSLCGALVMQAALQRHLGTRHGLQEGLACEQATVSGSEAGVVYAECVCVLCGVECMTCLMMVELDAVPAHGRRYCAGEGSAEVLPPARASRLQREGVFPVGKTGSHQEHLGSELGLAGSDQRNLGSEPGNSGTEPSIAGSVPEISGSELGNSGSEPGKSVSEPGKSGFEPGKSGSEPGKSGSGSASFLAETGDSDLVTTEADSGTRCTDTGKRKLDTGTSVPDMAISGSDTGTSGPDTGTSGPDTGTTEPDTGTTGSDTGTTGSDTGTTGSDTGTTGSCTGTSGSCTGTSGSDTGLSGPDTGTSGPDTGTSGPDTETTGLDTGTTRPDTGTTEPDTGTTGSDTGTSGPDTGTTVRTTSAFILHEFAPTDDDVTLEVAPTAADDVTQSRTADDVTQSRTADDVTQARVADDVSQSRAADDVTQSQAAGGSDDTHVRMALSQWISGRAKLLTVTNQSNFVIHTNSKNTVQSRALFHALAPRMDDGHVIARVGVVIASPSDDVIDMARRVYLCRVCDALVMHGALRHHLRRRHRLTQLADAVCDWLTVCWFNSRMERDVYAECVCLTTGQLDCLQCRQVLALGDVTRHLWRHMGRLRPARVSRLQRHGVVYTAHIPGSAPGHDVTEAGGGSAAGTGRGSEAVRSRQDAGKSADAGKLDDAGISGCGDPSEVAEAVTKADETVGLSAPAAESAGLEPETSNVYWRQPGPKCTTKSRIPASDARKPEPEPMTGMSSPESGKESIFLPSNGQSILQSLMTKQIKRLKIPKRTTPTETEDHGPPHPGERPPETPQHATLPSGNTPRTVKTIRPPIPPNSKLRYPSTAILTPLQVRKRLRAMAGNGAAAKRRRRRSKHPRNIPLTDTQEQTVVATLLADLLTQIENDDVPPMPSRDHEYLSSHMLRYNRESKPITHREITVTGSDTCVLQTGDGARVRASHLYAFLAQRIPVRDVTVGIRIKMFFKTGRNTTFMCKFCGTLLAAADIVPHSHKRCVVKTSHAARDTVWSICSSLGYKCRSCALPFPKVEELIDHLWEHGIGDVTDTATNQSRQSDLTLMVLDREPVTLTREDKVVLYCSNGQEVSSRALFRKLAPCGVHGPIIRDVGVVVADLLDGDVISDAPDIVYRCTTCAALVMQGGLMQHRLTDCKVAWAWRSSALRLCRFHGYRCLKCGDVIPKFALMGHVYSHGQPQYFNDDDDVTTGAGFDDVTAAYRASASSRRSEFAVQLADVENRSHFMHEWLRRGSVITVNSAPGQGRRIIIPLESTVHRVIVSQSSTFMLYCCKEQGGKIIRAREIYARATEGLPAPAQVGVALDRPTAVMTSQTPDMFHTCVYVCLLCNAPVMLHSMVTHFRREHRDVTITGAPWNWRPVRSAGAVVADCACVVGAYLCLLCRIYMDRSTLQQHMAERHAARRAGVTSHQQEVIVTSQRHQGGGTSQESVDEGPGDDVMDSIVKMELEEGDASVTSLSGASAPVTSLSGAPASVTSSSDVYLC